MASHLAALTVPRRSALIVLVLTSACGSIPTDGDSSNPPGPQLPVLEHVIVSNPQAVAGGAHVVFGIDGPVVYVSMSPGSFPDAERVTIGKSANVSVIARVVDGGWDPTAIRAAAGDTLHLGLMDSSGTRDYIATVPRSRKGPIIVRTEPAPQKRDVPLNANLVIVFDEPLDPRTVGPATIQLSHDGLLVATSVALEADAPWKVSIVPASLEPGTDYELTISPQVAGQDGEPLGAQVSVPFTTAGPALSGRIAFSRLDASGEPGIYYRHLYVLDLERKTVTQLTAGAVHDDQAVWSSDGRQLAFVRNGGFRDGEVFVMNADGTGLHSLGPGHSPAWSRDSVRRVAFFQGIRYAENIVILNADGSGAPGGASVPAFNLSLDDLRWSPDGRTFAFHASDEAGLPGLVPVELQRILLMNTDGTNLRGLDADCDACSRGGGEVSPAWSPDGSTLAYWIYAAPFFGFASVQPRPAATATILTTIAAQSWPFPGRLDWSPDGKWIVYSPGWGLRVLGYPAGISSYFLAGTEGATNPSWSR